MSLIDKKSYKIIGKAFRHCLYSNNPTPPTTISKYMEWDWNVEDDDDLVFYVDDSILKCETGRHNKKIALLIEPVSKKKKIYDWLVKNHNKFYKVLLNDKIYLNLIPNSVFYPLGGCWIEEENRRKHEKIKLVSIVASGKRQVPAHHIRHEIIKKYSNIIDVYGRGYNPIDSITLGLKDYMFNISVENQKRDYHFSEKIINPIMTYTVPIYRGMDSISDFFDERGMLFFNDSDDIEYILKRLDYKLYLSMVPYIENNFKMAQEYILAEDWLYRNGFFKKI